MGAAVGAGATGPPLPSPLIGPSLELSAYILRSYLALMYFSTTGSAELVGFAPGGRLASQYAFARSLPIVSMSTTCFSFHVSNVVERTNDMCTPSERWMPEQFVQMKMPRLTDAQRGWREGQSAHSWFSGRFKHASRRLRSFLCSSSDISRCEEPAQISSDPLVKYVPVPPPAARIDRSAIVLKRRLLSVLIFFLWVQNDGL